MYIRFHRSGEARSDRVLSVDEHGVCTGQAKMVLTLWALGDPFRRRWELAPHSSRTTCAAARLEIEADRHDAIADLDRVARSHGFELSASREPVEGFAA